MSKLNINKKEWLELVFEGKNKSYGAYQLREEDGKTTIKAFFSALLLLLFLSAIAVLFSSFEKKPIEAVINPNEKIILTNLESVVKKVEPIVVIPVKKGKALKAEKTADLKKKIKVVDERKAEKTLISTNTELGIIKDPNAIENGDGKGIPNGTETAIVIKEVKPTPNFEGLFNPSTVEVSPKFPGGINEFLKTVGKKFVTPQIDEAKTIRVIVIFVVEKDGSLSNIKVPNDPGFGLGAEAIRVLKAIKTKWEPGYMGETPVRTMFSLPIIVKTTIAE